MNVQPVNASHVFQVWPEVEKYIVSAFESPGADCTADQAKVYLSRGLWQLVVVSDDTGIHGAVIVEYINRANHRVAYVIAVGGRLIADAASFEQLKAVLRMNGATVIEGAVRESVGRLWRQKFGAKEKYRIVEVSL